MTDCGGAVRLHVKCMYGATLLCICSMLFMSKLLWSTGWLYKTDEFGSWLVMINNDPRK